jgi:hypothetical protein
MNANITHSAEVRWIMEGEIPPEVKNWFKGDNQEPVRVDYYWNVPNCEVMGIKLRRYPPKADEKPRDPNLEFKPLVTVVKDFSLPKGVEAQVDIWDKWSTEGDASKKLMAQLSERKASWLAIRKTRWLRKYSAEQGAIRKVDAKTRPPNGCNVELTELRVGSVDEIREDAPNAGKAYWTIGFEAFDDPNVVTQILREVVKAELTAADCPKELKPYLIKQHSWNYPECVTSKAKGTSAR